MIIKSKHYKITPKILRLATIKSILQIKIYLMIKNRRKFIQTASTIAAGGLILPLWACKDNKSTTMANDMAKKADKMTKGSLEKFGIQLYTLRDDMPKDPKGVITKLAGYGYKQIESYDGPQGIFWDQKNTEFKKFLDGLGLSVKSAHVDIYKDFERKCAEGAEIGMDYMICPYVGPQTSKEAWQKIVDKFNECGDICKKNGIQFAYHNHAYSFKPFSGMIPHEFLMDNTNPDTVKHQMDIYWVVSGGADPIEYLKKYSGRFTLCHVKDRMKNAGDEREASCDLGTGIIDFPKILKVAKENGMEYFIMEQERYDGSTPLKSAEAGAAYLKDLVFV